MDTSYEDKIYRQIEKNLSSNINDKLFVPIEMIDENLQKSQKRKRIVDSVSYEEKAIQEDTTYYDKDKLYDNRLNNNKDIEKNSEDGPRISRAEYIRQAREACLRQMNTLDSSVRASDIYIGEEDSSYFSQGKKKKDKTSRLFYDGGDEEVLPEDIASFKSLIIRTVFAVVLFICIFVIDKIKVDWGAFSHETIREYVTGNNQLKVLEEIIISLLK